MKALLVCGGKYHDFAFASRELQTLLQEIDGATVVLADDYDIVDELADTDVLITYTCDLMPSVDQQHALRDWLTSGKRWFALHGTNSVIQWISNKPLKIGTPDAQPGFTDMLGSRFLAHPPICDFRVNVSAPDHPLVQGIEPFDTNDEIYLVDVKADIDMLLHCDFQGETKEFERVDWSDSAAHPVMYLHRFADGEVLYLTLGHCRGHGDMRPLIEHYPVIERCSWEMPIYYELLRRGIRWGLRID